MLVSFGLICVFVSSKYFRKKNNKLAWNCPDNVKILYYCCEKSHQNDGWSQLLAEVPITKKTFIWKIEFIMILWFNLSMKILRILDFGVSTAISSIMLNHAISLKGYTQGDNIFTFLYKFLGIFARKWLGQLFRILIWVYFYLLNGIRLDLDLD